MMNKQKGFLLNPFRFSISGGPSESYVLGTTNLLSEVNPFDIGSVIPPFTQQETDSFLKINDGILLSSDSNTFSVVGQGSAPNQNRFGAISFFFPEPKRVGRIKISFSPLRSDTIFYLQLSYLLLDFSGYEIVGDLLCPENYGEFATFDIDYLTYPDAVGYEWVIMYVGPSDLTLAHEIRIGEIEMYEWIPA